MPLLVLLQVKLQALSAETGSQQALSAAAAGAINAGDAHAALCGEVLLQFSITSAKKKGPLE